jgi:cytochrome c oxidase cbb3-type subunit 2
MLHKSDKNASLFVVLALGLFFLGGLLTTVLPAMVDKSWGKPFENSDPSKGPTGKLVQYTALEQKGYEIYIREGCKYCHTQQTRTLESDTIRSGWKGVKSPVSTPDEFVYDYRQTFGTKRTGPDLSRVGGKYNAQWHKAHFKNPRDLVPGSTQRAGSVFAEPWPCQELAPGQRLRAVRGTMQDYTYQSVLFAYLLFVIFFGLAAYFFFRTMKAGYWGKESEAPKYRMLEDDPLDAHKQPPAPRRN